MSQPYNPLSNRWFNLAVDVCRTSVKAMVMVEERTLDITKAMVNQIDAVQEHTPSLLQEFTHELKRTQMLVEETLGRARTFNTGNVPVPRLVNGRIRVIRELPSPDDRLDQDLDYKTED